MEALINIPIEELPELRDLYKVNWPLHVSTHSTIQLFIDRFKNFPEWTRKVSFLSFKDWRAHGAFVMTSENRIFFNTLEKFPFDILRRALMLIDLDDKTTFVNIRDSLRCIVLDLLRIHHLEVVSDIGTKSFLIPRETLLDLDFEVPDDLELKPVRREHAKKINALWPGRFENSEKFLEDAIQLNPSMGIYNKKTGEILAWNMRIDNGSMGAGQVDESNQGNFYGHIAVAALSLEIAKNYNSDVHFEIVHGNFGAEKSARLNELQLIDTQSWISVRKRKKLTAAPLWGHL